MGEDNKAMLGEQLGSDHRGYTTDLRGLLSGYGDILGQNHAPRARVRTLVCLSDLRM